MGKLKIAVVSLGCPKNQVDADVFCRALIEAGHQTVPSAEMADVIIINTCGFIDSAKEEAIDCILDACELKTQNPAVKVVVTGCLAERYKGDVAKEMPEVDAVVGIGANTRLPEIIAGFAEEGKSEKNAPPLECYDEKSKLALGGKRVVSTPMHYAWLKIAEGCSNACSYCAIPYIRGPLRSRPLESVVEEAKWLAQQGVKELVLVAQDVTAYGEDSGENRLPQLLQRLNEIDGIQWIRLLYAYPEKINEELLCAVAQNEKVLHYFDLPVQHVNEEILKSMRRRGGENAVRNAVKLIRQKMPNAVLRTSLIAGYPGETEEQFIQLCDFVREVRFDRLGCFAYSPEEGTPAEKMPNQIPQEERERRAEAIMRIQGEIMEEKQAAQVDKTLEVLCDELSEEEGLWLCRSRADAPEIDLNVLVNESAPLAPGCFYKVKITGTDGFDLTAELDI